MEKAIRKLNEKAGTSDNIMKEVKAVIEAFSETLAELAPRISKSADEAITRLYNEAVTLVDAIKENITLLEESEWRG